MYLKHIIFTLILLFILVWLFYIKYEKFTVYPYNLDINIQDKSQIQLENEKIQSIFDKEFKNNNLKTLEFNKDTFNELSFYENFIFETQFKSIVLNKLKNVLSNDFPNIKLSSPRDLKQIYWKNIDNNRYYIFDIVIYSENYGFTRVFNVYTIIKNINNYLFDNGEYIPGIKLNETDIEIINITESLNDNFMDLNIQSKPLFDYFEIKNKLFLTDPFITSGKDIQITKELREKFEKKLLEKSKTLELYSIGKCFDENNNVLFSDENSIENKTKCEDINTPLNAWDTLPFNDYDCPFYKKNTNYPNDFGKLNDNACEMPLNAKLKGYRYYTNEPLCYNCKTDLVGDNSLGTCCDKQLNKTEYPNLSSPDYAFDNDKLLRQKYNSIFIEKNLNVE